MKNSEIIKTWEQFMKGTSFNTDMIKRDILDSWRRCREKGVSVDSFDRQNIVSPEELEHYTVVDERRFAPFLKVCGDLDIAISFYDEHARLRYVFNKGPSVDEQWENSLGFFRDAGEEKIGTNSVGLALFKRMPSQVLGSEHYKLAFRECSCTAAPVTDGTGKIIGALNYSRMDLNQTGETINLLYSLARFYENIINGLDTERGMGKNKRIETSGRAVWTFDNILYHDAKMQMLIAIAKKVARTEAPIILYGESGVGKELFASAIHNQSRRGGKFVAVNCGAIPQNLIESELFGYEGGAFTGADRKGKIGLIEYSSGGTLFLDEIESMPLETQIRFLRVLSSYTVKRIGGLNPVPVDLRIIAASKKNLFDEVIRGNFREDLYYRLNVVDIGIPPLRERKEDIAVIAGWYADEFSKKYAIEPYVMDDGFLSRLTEYNWPGNVRELKNIIERSVIFAQAGHLDIGVIPHNPSGGVPERERSVPSRIKEALTRDGDILRSAENAIIEMIIDEENGNISKAAKRLGLSRQAVYNRYRQIKERQLY